ncbi:hypothetical protein AC14_1668 [Escherichia coli 2-052-05_S3_C2]|nr:hypothetical protein AC14_1668 [Escherichia coli 2-052-05_S3_C2]
MRTNSVIYHQDLAVREGVIFIYNVSVEGMMNKYNRTNERHFISLKQ